MGLLRIAGVVVTTALLFLLSQCSTKESVIAPNIAALVGTWQLLEPDSTYRTTLQFAYDTRNPPQDITPFNANGKTSINSYTLRLFATLDGTMSADNLSNTDKAGSAEAMQFDQTYFANLNTVARYDLPARDRLHLHHGGKQPGVLVYKRLN